MFDSPWFAPAVIMNLSAYGLMFLLSWAVSKRHDAPYFRWWVASAGLGVFGASVQAIDFFVWPHPALTALWVCTTFFNALALIASGRRIRGDRPFTWRKWGVGVAGCAMNGALVGGRLRV